MLKVGDVVGRYSIEAEINRGSFCDSFIAVKDGKRFFLKEYSKPTEASDEFRAFFRNQEAIIPFLKKLGGVTEEIVEHFVKGGIYYQVKTLLKGESLSNWMEHELNYAPRLEAALFLTQIVRAIHSVGIVHQDLKPDQVMVVSEHPVRLVLTDFDWSFPEGKMVIPVGTPWYAHPDGLKANKKADIFSLGIILCVLLTGSNPYQHNGAFDWDDWANWVRGRRYLQPKELNPEDVPDKINDIIVRCLSPDPMERPTLEEVTEALENPVKKIRKVRLVSGSSQMVIPVGASVDRRDFKIDLPMVTDPDGNPIYMYISHEVSALAVKRAPDGGVEICSPDPMTNRFRLNGKDIGPSPVLLSDGDMLELFSTKRGMVVAFFKVELG